MSRIRLILNGQGHALKVSGGVGKYSHELYKRIRSPEIQKYLPGVEVAAWDFPVLDEALVSSAAEPGYRVQNGLRNFARNWAPPKLFDFAKRVRTGSGDRSPSGSPIDTSAETTILHEVSNYTSCLQIARFSLQSSVRICVTFHDIQDFYYPEHFSDEELRYRKLTYLLYKEVAHQFFSNSEFTKRTMVERLGIPEAKIRVTYLAGNGLSQPNELQDDFARNFGRYLIFPAKFWKHKNHEFLLKAFSKRRDEFRRQEIQLLFTGGFSKNESASLRNIAREAGVEDQVQILGFLSTQALTALIRNAYFLVFPSLFEGFGMPVLEALESGCPVLCSQEGSLPEVAGDAAVYFDPRQMDSLVSVFDCVLNQSLDRKALIQNGWLQSRKFNWDRTFVETVEQYIKLV